MGKLGHMKPFVSILRHVLTQWTTLVLLRFLVRKQLHKVLSACSACSACSAEFCHGCVTGFLSTVFHTFTAYNIDYTSTPHAAGYKIMLEYREFDCQIR